MTSTATDRLIGLTTSVAVKAPCKAISTTTLTLSGEQTVNGTACVTGDRVLYALSGGSVSNGIWVVSTGAWTRAADFNGNRDVVQGTLVCIASDDGPFYRVTTADPITIGTTAIEFAPYSASDFLASTSSTALGDALVGVKKTATNAVATTQHEVNEREAHTKDYGVVTDGVTDDSTLFANALAASREVQLSRGTTYVKTNESTLGTTPSLYRMTGQGARSVINIEEQSAAGISEAFTMGAAQNWFERLKIIYSKALTGVSTLLLFKTRFDKLTLRELVIDGQIALSGGTADRIIHVVKSEDTVSTNTVIMDNLDVTSVSRVYTRDNADTTNQSIVKVIAGVFRDIWRTAFTFNAPSGTIKDVLVLGSSFANHAGVENSDSNLNGNDNAVGFEGVIGGRVIGVHVGGYYGSVSHIEETTNGCAIVANTAYYAAPSAGAAAFEIIANNIGGVATTPQNVAYVGNVAVSSDGVGVGYYIQSAVSLPGAEWCLFTGNITSDFDDAFKSATDARSVLVSNNVLRGVTSGLDLTRASLLIKDNVVGNSTMPITVDRGGLMGSAHFVNLTSETAAMTAFGEASSTGVLALTEWTWESDLFSSSNGANLTDLGPLPTRVYGMLTVAITASGNQHRTSTIEVTFDGASWTNTVKQAYGSGDITITGFATNTTSIALSWADASGPTTSVRIQVRFFGGQFII